MKKKEIVQTVEETFDNVEIPVYLNRFNSFLSSGKNRTRSDESSGRESIEIG